jgi:CRP/FNR family cyclic AMP-dependent transcriptional regulator
LPIKEHFLLGDDKIRMLVDLVPRISVRCVPAGKMLFKKGDPISGLFGVLASCLRSYAKSANSREVLFNFIEAGDLLGEIALIDGRPRTASAADVDDSDFMYIHRDISARESGAVPEP